MKARALHALLLLICAVSNFAQSQGQLIFGNRNIISPLGELYHIPIWVDLSGNGVFDSDEGIGTYAAAMGEPATLALYFQGSETLLATARFRSDLNGAFLQAPQDVFVTGYQPGETAPLTIKAWVGQSYDGAKVRASWDFVSPPLGGAPAGGGVPIFPPTLHSWAPIGSPGHLLQAPPGPIAGRDALTRRTVSGGEMPITSLLANDSDPSGGQVQFVSVDPLSNLGAPLTIENGSVVYHPTVSEPDFFYYTVRNSSGGFSRGRVDVVFALPEGQLIFGNRNIISPSGELYHIPIWVDLNGNGVFDSDEGIGTYAAAMGEPATLALYFQGSETLLATARFRSDLNGAFLQAPQDVFVAGYQPGETAPLTIKAWVGQSYDSATVRASWDFMSPPLGGTPAGGGVPIFPPTLHTWSPIGSSGHVLQTPPGPIAGTDVLTRRTLSGALASIASLLANDSDPSGGQVQFVSADPLSNLGAPLTIDNGRVIYHPTVNEPDFFFYTVRNSSGGVSRGRVNVVVDDPDGMIQFANRDIPRSDGQGFYSVPIYVDANGDGMQSLGEEFGKFAATFYGEPAKLGLFVKGSEAPLAISLFATNQFASLLGEPASKVVIVPGVPPGSQVELTIKAWIGASFETSRVRGAWDFMSRPLGGVVAGGSSFEIPGLTGWGDENGLGIGLAAGLAPIVGLDEMAREYGQEGRISVATLLANDIDPDGGPLTFLGADNVSHEGASVLLFDSGKTLVYRGSRNVPDYFFYMVRSSRGVVAKGRVSVTVGEAVGEIVLSNHGTPIWIDLDADGLRDSGEGIGDYAALIGQAAQASFHVQGNAEPFAVRNFSMFTGKSDGAFLIGSGSAFVPGSKPGDRAALTVKAWVGSSFETATVKGSWDFTTLPLGGPINEQETIVAPALTGWGNESGVGFALEADTNIVLPPILIPIVIGRPIEISYGIIYEPWTNAHQIIRLPEFTEGGHQIIQFVNNAVVNATLFENDSFAYSVLTPTGIGAGVVDLRVQESPAKIFLSNRLVRRSNGPGGYNIPVWVDVNFNGRRDRGEGIGSFAGKEFGANATLGLYLRDGTTPIATARFHRDGPGAFLEEPAFQEVTIPNASPGAQVPLTLKAWIGNSYASATIKGSWDFTSRPLGGGGHTGIFETPDVTGWGDESNGAGYAIIPGAKPRTYGAVITRQSGQNVNAKLADIFKSDFDPDGGALTLVSVDEGSKEGGVVSVLADTVYYVAPLQDTGAPDYFEYTVRNSKGGIAKGRVDVVVTDANGQFNTRLAIEHTASGNEITFRGIVGSNYLVQFRDDIDAPWQDLGSATHEAFGIFKVGDATPNAARFYRVVTQR